MKNNHWKAGVKLTLRSARVKLEDERDCVMCDELYGAFDIKNTIVVQK